MVRLQVAGRLGRVLQVVGFTVARARRGFREELLDAPCSRLSIVWFDTGPKRSMGHLLGAKKGIFLIRGRGRPTVYGARASGILSIPAKQVSLGAPKVGTIHVLAPTPHASGPGA